MSNADKPHSKQDKAIHDYLESLLFEVGDEEETELFNQTGSEKTSTLQPPLKPPESGKAQPLSTVPETGGLPHAENNVSSALIGLEKLVAEIPDTLNEPVTESITEVKTELKVETAPELKEQTQLQQQAELSSGDVKKLDSSVPEWAQNRFQCLLFKVSGLSLAVPLVKLNSVIPWNEEITKTPNQTEWYLGLVQHLSNQVKIIDTALLVMPENRHDKIEADPAERLSHILLVDDYQWGLACDSIGDVIWLTKDEVKWRKNKTTRAWLSGTSLEHLCAIMDTEVFAQMLSDAG